MLLGFPVSWYNRNPCLGSISSFVLQRYDVGTLHLYGLCDVKATLSAAQASDRYKGCSDKRNQKYISSPLPLILSNSAALPMDSSVPSYFLLSIDPQRLYSHIYTSHTRVLSISYNSRKDSYLSKLLLFLCSLNTLLPCIQSITAGQDHGERTCQVPAARCAQ